MPKLEQAGSSGVSAATETKRPGADFSGRAREDSVNLEVVSDARADDVAFQLKIEILGVEWRLDG